MAAPILNGPFDMPMVRNFIPRKAKPFLYLFMVVGFQLSGGMYLGSLSEIYGEYSLMREDILMCLYANLTGMAIYFPLLFRMKFAFTNKSLLTFAACGILLCNVASMFVTCLPILWMICFIAGFLKIQGTFECMSNIQLWMSPNRDFTVFFPILHIVILGAIQLSTIIDVTLTYYYNWHMMHWFVIGYMLVNLFIIFTCLKSMMLMKRLPLYGIDWSGALLWAALVLQVAFLFNYGDWYDWWYSPVIKGLTTTIIATAIMIIWRMQTIRHPYIEPKVWSYKYFIPLIIVTILIEAFLATEHVLEEVFYEEGMHYVSLSILNFNWVALVSATVGCLFSLWWLNKMHYSYLRLIMLGMVFLFFYLVGFYLNINQNINMERLYLPIACRGFSCAVISISMFVCLEEIMTFPHFFQALGIFNMVHIVIGGVIGSAIYAQGLRYYITDNMIRYSGAIDKVAFSRSPFQFPHFMEGFVQQMQLASVKQIYGWVCYACLLLLLGFMLCDTPIRHGLKRIPAWTDVRKNVSTSLKRRNNKSLIEQQ